MGARKGFNIIQFIAAKSDGSDGPRIALEPDGPIAWQPGFKPNVFSFRASWKEVGKLGSPLPISGRIEFFDYSDPAAKKATPDVAISDVRFIDLQPLDAANTALNTTQFSEFRLCFSDFRDRYLSPRGGRLTLGLINPKKEEKSQKTPNPNNQSASDSDEKDPQVMTFLEMVKACLKAMGLDPEKVKLPDGGDKIAAPQEVKWFGNHAPTELEKLLKRARWVFVPKLDGTIAIEEIGKGDLPNYGDDALPDLLVPTIDRRGKTLIITSYPSRILETRDFKGPGTGWRFVVQNANQNANGKDDPEWVDVNHYRGALQSMELDVRNGFVNIVPQKFRARVAYQAYRIIEVRPDDQMTSPILAQVIDKAGKPQQVVLKGKLATIDGSTNLWTNVETEIPASQVRGNNFIVLSRVAGLVDPDPVPLFSPYFKEVAEDSLTITCSFEKAEKDKDGKWRPKYFAVGFRQELGKIVQLKDDEVQNALDGQTAAGDDVVVITDPDLQLRIIDGKEVDKDKLVKAAKVRASGLIRGSGDPVKHLIGRGYRKVELSGQVSKVSWDPGKYQTEAEVANWWAPGGSLDPELYKEELDGDYPNQDKTESDRQSIGAQGERPPVIPLNPDATFTPPPAPVFPIHVKVDGGIAGGKQADDSIVDCTFTYSLFDLRNQPIKDRANPPQPITKQTPAKRRYVQQEYEKPEDFSLGFAYLDDAGNTKLWDPVREIPKVDECDQTQTTGGG